MNSPSPLIDAASLATRILPSAADRPAADDRPAAVDRAGRPVTVIDVRWRLAGPPGRADYLSGHIPGAVFMDLDADVCGPPGGGGRHPLPDIAALESALRTAGVRAGRPVVVYDDGDGMPAARLWWTLRWAGHTDVRVLDGGFAAWQRADLPVSSGPEAADPGDFTVRPGHLPVLDADHAAAYASHGALADARTAARFRGENETVDPIAGRVPGAVSLPYADLVNDDGTLRPADELHNRLADAGLSGSGPVGAYCGSGVTAAHTVLAMTVAGVPDAALYVGSWSEWITDPSRPIAVGDGA
ncbi:MAG TPA: sulfurtransferase [Micromonosporaceae bacterium]|nr:sulfurtransferase [Micromonosporaceae bacterium]